MGWFGAIIFGGLAGWIAEKMMKSDMGLIANIILGIVGAMIGGAILNFIFGSDPNEGWIVYTVSGILGACILIAAWRAIRGRSVA